MHDLFRFLVLRDPLPGANVSVDLGEGGEESSFLSALAAARDEPQPQQKMHELARRSYRQKRLFSTLRNSTSPTQSRPSIWRSTKTRTPTRVISPA